MNALEIRNLTKAYKGFTLDHLNLTLPSGCIMGLIGENGAGKTTTIKLILDMIRKDSGTISVLGQEHLNKEEIGVVMDEVGIPKSLKIPQIGKIMCLTFSNWNSAKFAQLCEQFALPKDKPFGSFSRGMRMKTGIAIALSHDSKLLILDEATSGLDPVARDEVLDLLNEYTRKENHSILISSHIVSDLEKLCDYIAFLHRGKLMLCEEKDVLLSEYGIVRGTAEQLAGIPTIHKKETPYGIEALVQRSTVPHGMQISPISIEELFILMAKEATK